MASYSITVADADNQDFLDGCAQIGMTPDELYSKVTLDAIQSARTKRAQDSVPPIVPPDPSNVDVAVS